MNLPKTAERRLRHAKIELFEQVSGRLDLFDYESIATLLVVDNKTANLMYDYGITIAEKIKTVGTAEQLIEQLVSKVDLYDFLVFYRKLASGELKLATGVFTYYLWLFNLVLELKVGVNVIGFNSGTGEVFVDEELPTMFESMLLLLPSFSEKIRPRFVISHLAKLTGYLEMKYCPKIKDKLLQKVLGCSTKLVSANSIAQLELTVFQELSISGIALVPTLLFQEKYEPQCWLQLMGWHRETVQGANANFLLLVLCTITDILEQENVLVQRQKLLSEDGVVLEFAKPFDRINEVKLAEIHDEKLGEHFFVITYESNGSKRTLPISLTTGSVSNLALYEIDFTVLMVVLEWLGVRRALLDLLNGFTDEQWRSVIVNSTKDVNSEELHSAIEAVMETIDNEIYGELLEGVRYLKPQHWNYEGTTKFNQKKSRVEQSDCFYEFRKIGAHVRKLKDGQHASADREMVAKKYCLELKPGYTLVEGYVRRQRVKELSTPTFNKSFNCKAV